MLLNVTMRNYIRNLPFKKKNYNTKLFPRKYKLFFLFVQIIH